MVWSRFGQVRHYVEPFFGSGAVLLARPQPWGGDETINDADGFVCNFWRALAKDPQAVAKYCDWPINECDLLARHRWLIRHKADLFSKLKEDPEYCNVKIAGWWVWGIALWIGSGWCHDSSANTTQPPNLTGGQGVHRNSMKLPQLGGGRGVHRESLKLPVLLGMHGVHRSTLTGRVDTYLLRLSERMRNVRVCCGDWSRVCGGKKGESLGWMTSGSGKAGIFLDPPYSTFADVYAEGQEVSAKVRKWCLKNGDNRKLRIALCGYEGEGHEELESHGWDVEKWKAVGGYANTGSDENSEARQNAEKERVWFSPHCLPKKKEGFGLF